MAFKPLDMSVPIMRAEQLKAQRAQQDPNSIPNQLAAERLKALKRGATTQLITNLEAAGFKRGTPEFNQQMILQLNKAKQANRLGKYNPGDYTPESWRTWIDAGAGDKNAHLLQRYEPPASVKVGGVQSLAGRSGDNFGDVTPLSTLPNEAESATVMAGAQEQGRQDVRLKTEPTIQAEIIKAENKANQVIQTNKNKVAYKTFNMALTSYGKALKNTTTGYFAGRLPAVTASQQIADGAKAVMLPILKQIFRTAGEGIFTDKDQEALELMLPTRKDLPETGVAKLNLVNQTVALKMNLEYGGDIFTIDAPSQQPGVDITTLSDDQLRAMLNGAQ